MKYHFNEEEFLKKIREGRVEDLETEAIYIFEKVMPKAAEIKKIQEAVMIEGYADLIEAKKFIKFGNIEDFMIKVSEIE